MLVFIIYCVMFFISCFICTGVLYRDTGDITGSTVFGVFFAMIWPITLFGALVGFTVKKVM